MLFSIVFPSSPFRRFSSSHLLIRVSPPLGKPSTTDAAPERLPRIRVPRRKDSCQATHVVPALHMRIRGRRPATQTAGARACLGDTSPTWHREIRNHSRHVVWNECTDTTHA